MAHEAVIRVLLVDDHAIVRTGIAGMLSDAEGIKVTGEAANGFEALEAIADSGPDVILMDLRMPGLDGPDTIRRLRQSGDERAILVLTTFDADTDIVRAIESGANGYLLKDATRDQLISAIRAVGRGESWLAPSVAGRLLSQMRVPANESLSERELDVLRLVAKGRSNKEIASAIHVSPATVKTHLIHIFRKLDVNDRTAAVTVALERGIISIDTDARHPRK
jgi:DNA-binding NarL/FixJ family response regulator